MRHIVITTLAEYQTVFWLAVAQALGRAGRAVTLLSFDDRSTEMLRTAGIATVSFSEVEAAATQNDIEDALSRAGPTNPNFWFGHERVAFARNDDQQMRRKLGGAIIAAEQALSAAGNEAVMLQELGGFLSVIGTFFAAQSHGIDNVFLEPSFFRGRFMLTPNSFGAPQPSPGSALSPECTRYLAETLASGEIVIPKKDSHHYNSAVSKIANRRNLRRLGEKLTDKYLFGKQQEFGFIGTHVRQHTKMLLNSRKLRKTYTPINCLEQFIYYPFHVPGDVALTLRAPEYLDQLSLVDYLCRTTPDHLRVAVKEHPAMIGAIDAARLADLARRYPKLAILDPGTNNYRVLRSAEGIVTVNSKSGAEAGLLGKPVIVLGDAFYRAAPFAQGLNALSELRPALAALNGYQPNAEAIGSWFQAVWQDTLPGELYYSDTANIRAVALSLQSRL
ncbi:MAG TPA: hypothetical protein VFT61_06280 [Sphingomicrobium sp.]|nr:hypothetical protein [Sphingomicrobium sp.]